MKLLLDTCAILHFSAAPDRLSPAVLSRLTAADSEVCRSSPPTASS